MNLKTKKALINLITLLRIIGIPLIFYLSGIKLFLYLNFLFLTDFFDGYLARKYNLTSNIGAILDLIADKSLTIFLLFVFAYKEELWLWIAILLIVREIYSIIIRVINYRTKNELIKASIFGKTKTFLQFIAFDALILNIPGYMFVFIIVLILSYYSITEYTIKFIKGMKNE